MFMFFDIGENIYLIDGALFELFIFFKSSYFDHLYRVLLGIKFVRSSIYFSIGALADDFVKGVVFYDSDHLVIKKIKNNFK